MLNAPIYLCVTFILGILAAKILSVWAFTAYFAVSIILLLLKKHSIVVFILFFAAGQVAFVIANKVESNANLAFSDYDGRYITGAAHVVEPVRVQGDKIIAVAKCDQLNIKPASRPVLLELHITNRIVVKTGDRVKFSGEFVRVDPGDRYRITRHLRGMIRVGGIKIEKATLISYKVAQAVNSDVSEIAGQFISQKHRALFSGMLLGDISSMDPKQKEDFKRSGLTHLVAVSGSNLAMIAVPIIILLTWVGLSRIYRFAIILSVIFLYAVATGLQAPVLRASIMTTLALYGIFFVGHKKGLFLISMAGIILLAWDPFLLENPGFLFSFASTLGLIILMRPFEEYLRFLPEMLSLPIATTLAAQVLVIPISSYYFGEISVVSFFANLVVTPLVPLITNSGLLAVVLNNTFKSAVFLPALLSDITVGLLVKAGAYFGSLQWAMTDITFSFVMFLLYFAGIYLFLLEPKIRSETKIKLAVSIILIWGLVLSWQPILSPGRPSTDFEVTFFDVGQADSALVRTKSGIDILIDTGKSNNLALRRLRESGVKKIDLLIISHFEEDHSGGTLAILKKYNVSTIIGPAASKKSNNQRQISQFLRKNGTRLILAKQNDQWKFGNITIKVFNPRPDKQTEELNNASLVIKLVYGSNSFLFPGDIEEETQDILERDKDLQSDVLKVPHHGAADAADAEFLETVDPSLAVVSAGRNNPYGHPSGKYLSLLNERSIKTMRTDKLGNVKITSNGREVSFSGSDR